MITFEKLAHHITHLREKHDKLDKQIELMESTGSFEDADLQHFKKQRLAIKDEIELNLQRQKEFQ